MKKEMNEAIKADILENAPAIIAFHDTRHHIIWGNKAYRSAAGMSIEEMEGKKCYHVWGLDKPCPNCPVTKVLETGRPAEGELTPNNQDHWPETQRAWLCKAAPIADHHGNIIGIVETAFDITERRQAEQEKLRESEDRYRLHFENASDVLFAIDPELKLIDISPSVEGLLGYKPEELIGRPFQELNVLAPEYPEQAALNLRRVLGGEPIKSAEHQFVARDGAKIWAEITGTPLVRDKEVVAVLSVARDVTERKRKDDKMRARNAELAILHDFSTLMRAAVDTSELLQAVMEKSCDHFNVQDGTVNILSPDGKEFSFVFSTGLLEESTGQTFPVDQGISGVVLKTGTFYVTEDYSSEGFALTLESGGQKDLGPATAVPLKSEEALIGVLVVARRHEESCRPFSQAEVDLLCTIGEMVGQTLRRIQLYEDTQRRLRQAEALRNIDMAIAGSLDLRVTFRTILDEITSQLGVSACAILRRAPYSQRFRYEAWRGFTKVKPEDFEPLLSDDLPGRLVEERRTIHIPALTNAEPSPALKEIVAAEGFSAYYGVPLIIKGRVEGVLELFDRKAGQNDEEWAHFLEILAGQTSVAIDNAEMFHDLERKHTELLQAYDATLEGWGRALSLKEEETEGHSRRVTDLTVQMAKAMGMKPEDVTDAWRGALLHDLGKIGVPDTILLKPGKLTDDEWAVMQQHPMKAFEMLSPIRYLGQAIDIPYCHHEKWDGTGYPRGLKGEQIPIAARIFAVVDVWDALISDRPYRKAWPKEKALAYIREQSGKHFDRNVVKQFLKLMRGR